MSKYTHTVTAKEWAAALHSWYVIMNKDRGGSQYANPYRFIGAKDFTIVPRNDAYCEVQVTEAAYNKVRMLNSPHARTLLKAFAARTGYQKPIP